MQRSGQVWVSALLYMLISAVVLGIILLAALPLLQNMRDEATLELTKKQLIMLNEQIRQVISEGEGSKRVIPIEVVEGELYATNSSIGIEFPAKSEIISHKSEYNDNGLVLYSDFDVSAYDYGDYYILENTFLIANITKFANYSLINTSRLINSIKWKDAGSETNGTFEFLINNDAASAVGYGYTRLKREGSHMQNASVIVYVYNATLAGSPVNYRLILRLDSQSDYLMPLINLE